MISLEQKKKHLKRIRIRNITLNTVCIALAVWGISWACKYFWRNVNFEVTNDAYVDQYIAPVNIRVAGYVKEVRFKEHQYVHRGDTLLLLDDSEYRIRVKEAQAALLEAEGSADVLASGVRTSQTNLDVQDANIEEARVRMERAEQDYRRYERLLAEGSVAEQQYEQMKADYEAARARYQAMQGGRRTARSQYEESAKRHSNVQASIMSCEAALELARLNLSYTVVTAPYDGFMGRRTLEEGQYVEAGQTLSYLVRSRDKWVTANYRETQINDIYIGQEVDITVDALPGRRFKGVVTAISEATGSKYALVPTDNAAGNFVKVQQRIPVRIDLRDVSPEDMSRLRAGMMVETAARRK